MIWIYIMKNHINANNKKEYELLPIFGYSSLINLSLAHVYVRLNEFGKLTIDIRHRRMKSTLIGCVLQNCK